MRALINGQERTVPEGATVADVLALLDMETARGVAVELDGAFVEREEYGTRRLEDGARLEVVRFVGGG
jgi:sulfur carrier protein